LFNFINKKNLLFFVKLNKPHAFKIGPDGKIYIVDTLNHRICRYSKKGKFLGWIGESSSRLINKNLYKTKDRLKPFINNLGLSRPFGMKIWKDKLYIADKNNYRIKIIKSNFFNKNVIQ